MDALPLRHASVEMVDGSIENYVGHICKLEGDTANNIVQVPIEEYTE